MEPTTPMTPMNRQANFQRTRRRSREVLLETRRPSPLSSTSARSLATWLAPRRSQIALDLINFFVADVAGLGALTFIYLITPEAEGGRGMDKTKAGLLMTTLGMVGVCAAPLVGMAVDTLRQKRALVACGLCCTAGCYGLLVLARSSVAIGALLCLQGLVGAVYAPSINALSLGIVGYERLPARKARNEVATHIGALLSALLPMVLVNRRAPRAKGIGS